MGKEYEGNHFLSKNIYLRRARTAAANVIRPYTITHDGRPQETDGIFDASFQVNTDVLYNHYLADKAAHQNDPNQTLEQKYEYFIDGRLLQPLNHYINCRVNDKVARDLLRQAGIKNVPNNMTALQAQAQHPDILADFTPVKFEKVSKDGNYYLCCQPIDAKTIGMRAEQAHEKPVLLKDMVRDALTELENEIEKQPRGMGRA